MNFEKINNNKFSRFEFSTIKNPHFILGGAYVNTDGDGSHDGYDETGASKAEDNWKDSSNGTDLDND